MYPPLLIFLFQIGAASFNLVALNVIHGEKRIADAVMIQSRIVCCGLPHVYSIAVFPKLDYSTLQESFWFSESVHYQLF